MLPEQSFLLFRETARVLRPGGRALISYLDIASPAHQRIFQNLVEHQANRIDPLVFLDRHFLDAFAASTDLRLAVHLLPEEVRVEAPPGARLLDGREISGGVTLNQAIAVLVKP